MSSTVSNQPQDDLCMTYFQKRKCSLVKRAWFVLTGKGSAGYLDTETQLKKRKKKEVISGKREFIDPPVTVWFAVHDVHHFMFGEDWKKREVEWTMKADVRDRSSGTEKAKHATL